MRLDEPLAWSDVIPHEHVEGLVGHHGVVDSHLQQRAGLGVHSGIPELLGVHLAQTLVALDGYLAVGVALPEPLDDFVTLLSL